MGTPHARSPDPADGFWVFAYGSLMWRPGFAASEIRKARLDGYKRAFALSSVHYRGNDAFPGLVLGLDWDPANHCTGMALRVDHEQAHEVRHYLAERELVSRAYFEVRHPVTLLCPGGGTGPAEGTRVEAICYILDRTHPQYAGGMALEDQAAIICRAEGSTGTNRDYLFNTAAHLRDLGIEEPDLATLEAIVQRKP
ncbi:MAG: gamma-glutamylcyclotransferase [Paracoccaceae bacterium]|nr:gamma-glutamylcyclotransferase [Paracoccaceae bacterium]